MTAADHKAEAQRWLMAADARNDDMEPDSYVQAAALIAIGHALLAALPEPPKPDREPDDDEPRFVPNKTSGLWWPPFSWIGRSQ